MKGPPRRVHVEREEPAACRQEAPRSGAQATSVEELQAAVLERKLAREAAKAERDASLRAARLGGNTAAAAPAAAGQHRWAPLHSAGIMLLLSRH